MKILGRRSYFGIAHSPTMPGPPGHLPPFVDNTVVKHGSGYHARSMDVCETWGLQVVRFCFALEQQPLYNYTINSVVVPSL